MNKNKGLPAEARRAKVGEIATTITLITLVVMLAGTLLGTQQAVRDNVQKYLLHAETGSACYKPQSCRSSTDTISCGPTMECKNVSRTPLQNDYRCVTKGVSCTSSSPESCWCPAWGPFPTVVVATPAVTGARRQLEPTAIPTPTRTPISGNAFKPRSFQCEVDFPYEVDPIVSKVEIRTIEGSMFGAQSMSLGLDINGQTPIGKEITHASGGTAGLTVRIRPLDPVIGKYIIVTVNQGGGAAGSRTEYRYIRPDWLSGSEQFKVYFEYTTRDGRRFTQDGTSNDQFCAPRPTPTPTPQRVCNSSCQNDSDCRNIGNNIKNPFCFRDNATDQANCRSRDCVVDASDCRCKNPTNVPTATPTPVRVCNSPCQTDSDCQNIGKNVKNLKSPFCLINGVTEQGSCRSRACPNNSSDCQCNPPPVTPPPPTITPFRPLQTCKNITYLLDTSSTMFTSHKLTEATDAIKAWSPPTGVQYRLISFNYDVQDETKGFVPYGDSTSGLVKALANLNEQHGTSLPKALNIASGTVILLSDGLPSYDLDRCFYGSSVEMSKIHNQNPSSAGPDNLSATDIDPNYGTSHAPASAQCGKRKYGRALADTVLAASGKTIHAIEVKDGGETNTEVLQAIGKGGSYHPVGNLSDAIGVVLKTVCGPSVVNNNNRVTSKSSSAPVIQSTSLGHVSTTFNVTNNTSSRTVNNLTMSLCDSTGSCTDKNEPLNLLPGGRTSVPTTFDNLTATGQYTVKCQIRYADGSSEACPEKQVSTGSSTKVAVDISQTAPVAVSTRTKEKSCDTNNDGACTAIDYALTVANYGKTNSNNFAAADLAGDANFDGTVDSIDLSIVLAGLGE